MTPRPHPRRCSARLWPVLAALALAGCSLFGKPVNPLDAKAAVKAPAEVVRNPGRKSLVVGLDQAGARIELGLDQQLSVRLLTRVAQLPEWTLVDLAPGVVQAKGPRFEPDVRTNFSGEVEGATVWQLKPVAAGNVTLRFEYRRAHSTAPAVQVVTYDLVVR